MGCQSNGIGNGMAIGIALDCHLDHWHRLDCQLDQLDRQSDQLDHLDRQLAQLD